MRPLLVALMKEGVLSIVVLILLCALVWIGGEFLKTPENDLFKERIAIIAVLIGLFLCMFVTQKILAVRNSVRIEQQLKKQSGSQLEGAGADRKAEVEALRKKFEESIEALKKTKGGKSALFTLPWYVIIGPPGSGKTTALQESGLNFPASQGGAKVRGIGGTRNCDWWFTEDGILLDTAGRYTTVAEDQEEWFAFLEMIRTSRKQKPINGAIVAISTEDLFRAHAAEFDQMARDVRNRIDELAARLQANFPVYVMFTKCDLVPGFVEFFEDFNKDQRGQVLGFTFPYQLPDRQYVDVFSDEFDKMSRNVAARRLDLLGTDRPPAKKQSIYLFPRQFSLAAEKMREFLGALFTANAFQESAVLRGIYFTSGTQKGTPIDQILARMGQAMGFTGSSDAPEERLEKRSYFIHDLFTKIIFHDKTLARSSNRVLRKRRAMKLGMASLSILVLTVMSYVLIHSFVGNRSMVKEVEAAGVAVKEKPEEAPSLERLQALEALREQLAVIDGYRRNGRPASMSLGMYQGNRMFEAGGKLYFQRLKPLHIEPCGQRVERELQKLVDALGPNSPSSEYQTLLDLWRVYRMMGGELEAQPALVSTILKRNNRWTGPLLSSDQALIESLAGEQLDFYASQLAARDGDPFSILIKVDPQLDTRASDKLQNAFWEVSAYEAIIQHTSESRPRLTLENLAPTNNAFIELRVPATGTNLLRLNAFTQDAWDMEVKALIDDRASDLARLYRELNRPKSEDEIKKDLYQRHRNAHLMVWNHVLENVHPRLSVFSSVKDTNEALRTLAGDQSPYRELIRNVWRNRGLTLSVGDRIEPADDAELKSILAAMDELGKFSGAYNDFWTLRSKEGSRFTNYIDDTVPLDSLAKAFRDADANVPRPFSDRNESARKALTSVIDAAFDALRVEAEAESNKLWKDGAVTLWNSSIKDRYPFNARATQNVSMANFSMMFNPKDGRVARANARLRGVESLTFHKGRKLITLSNEFALTVQQAGQITEAMFATSDDTRVSVNFSVTLMNTGLLVHSLIEIGTDADGKIKQLAWNDRPTQTADFSWAQFTTGNSKMGARVSAWYTQQRVSLPPKNLWEDEWGLLKMVRQQALSFTVDTSGPMPAYRSLWEFKAPDGTLHHLQATFIPKKAVNPFDEVIFTRFTMAEAVNQ